MHEAIELSFEMVSGVGLGIAVLGGGQYALGAGEVSMILLPIGLNGVFECF